MQRASALALVAVGLTFGAAFGLLLSGRPPVAPALAQNPSSTATLSPTASTTPFVTPTASRTPLARPCGQNFVTPGWNLVGGPTGTSLVGAVLPLYTLDTSGATYQPVSSDLLTAPQGYWALFNSPAPPFEGQPCVASVTTIVTLPASQYVMVGNPFNGNASINTSAPAAWGMTYNTYLNSWSSWVPIGSGQSMQLMVGQGAFVYSSTAATLTITPS